MLSAGNEAHHAAGGDVHQHAALDGARARASPRARRRAARGRAGVRGRARRVGRLRVLAREALEPLEHARAERRRRARRASPPRSGAARRSRRRMRAGCRRRWCRGRRARRSAATASVTGRPPIGKPPPRPLPSVIDVRHRRSRARARTCVPVRPMPVCTSSRISSAPTARVRRRSSAQVAGRRDVDAAFALDRLDDEGGAVAVDRELGGARSPNGMQTGSCSSARYGVPVLRRPDHRERAERAAVERLRRGDELRASGGAVRELQRALDRLGARVHDEAARDRGRHQVGELFDQVELGQRVEAIGRLHQPAGLLGDRRDERRVAVADGR